MATGGEQNEWDVSNIGESSGACVHGVITRVSPIKDSTRNPKLKYFNANMTDGKKSIRPVSFDTSYPVRCYASI